MLENEQWAGFEGRIWKEEINVRDFIQKNYKPYDSGEISKHTTPITYVDYEKNYEVILDKDGKQLPPLSAGSDKVNIELIFKMFEQFPMHQV